MSVRPFLRRLKTDKHLNIQSVLMHLQHLQGLVYLHHQNAPIIGFLPQSFWSIQKGTIHRSKRESFTHYSTQIAHHFNDFKDYLKTNPTSPTTNLEFTGGMIGFVSYDYAAQQHITLQQHPEQLSAFFGLYFSFLKYEKNAWYFYSYENNAEQLYEYLQALIHQKPQITFALKTACKARWSKEHYQHAFDQVQNYIKAGDCYQINLTQEFTAKAQGLLLDTAEDFWQLTNAPYSGYLKIDDFELLSCSPELFIEFDTDRKILTKPIKGTMPRYDDPILDEQSKNTLIHSKKDQAENVMIVDLLRNDLSVYAEIGSVKTPKLFNIESFNQVHHMVSEVTATLKENINPFEMLLSALPGGSITGAPKIRAMQIIDELEGAPRGAYCGSMGYFNFDGTGCWNILIRSIQKYQDNVSIWAGGGITIASDCDAEYQECFDKVSAMLDLLNTWYQPEKTQEKSES